MASLVEVIQTALGNESLNPKQILSRIKDFEAFESADHLTEIGFLLASESQHFKRVGKLKYCVVGAEPAENAEKTADPDIEDNPFSEDSTDELALESEQPRASKNPENEALNDALEVGYRGPVPLSRLKPNEINAELFPITLSPESIAPLAASLKEFGQREAITCGPDGTIYNGDRRHRGLISIGATEALVHVVPAMTIEQLRRYTIDSCTSVRSLPLREKWILLEAVITLDGHPKGSEAEEALATRVGLSSWSTAAKVRRIFKSKIKSIIAKLEAGEISITEADNQRKSKLEAKKSKASKPSQANTPSPTTTTRDTDPAPSPSPEEAEEVVEVEQDNNDGGVDDAVEETDTSDNVDNTTVDTNPVPDKPPPSSKPKTSKHQVALDGLSTIMRVVKEPLATACLDLYAQFLSDLVEKDANPGKLLIDLLKAVSERKAHFQALKDVEDMREDYDDEFDDETESNLEALADDDDEDQTPPDDDGDQTPPDDDGDQTPPDDDDYYMVDEDGNPIDDDDDTARDEIDELLDFSK